VPRLICDGANGLLVEPGSGEQLTYSLGRLLGDRRLQAQFSREGRRTIEERYSFDARMRRIGDLYNELLNRVPQADCVPVG